MTREPLVIIGSGMSGLGAGQSGALLFEAGPQPGGICHSYYMDATGKQTARSESCFRFEPAGGHWHFYASPSTLAAFQRVTPGIQAMGSAFEEGLSAARRCRGGKIE